MRASWCVGRVGGLAIALGIGAAFGGVGSGIASATPADPSDATTRASADSGSAAVSPRSAPQRSPGAAKARSAASAETGRANRRVAANQARPAAASALQAGSPSAVVLPASPVAANSASTALVPPAARASVAEAIAPQPVSTALALSALPALVSPVPANPASAARASVQAVVGHAMAAVVSSLLGSGPLTPLESPIHWTVLAAARRQSGQSGVGTIPAAMVSTGQAASGTAGPVAFALAASQPPVIGSITLGAPNASNGAVTGTVEATDPKGRKLTYKATSPTKGAVVISKTGVFTYTPTAVARHAAAKTGALVTTETVTVTVSSFRGGSVSQSVSVPITPLNAVPTTTTSVGTPNASTGVVTGSVTAKDANSDPLTYAVTANPAKGAVTFTPTTKAFTYTPTAEARHAAAKTGASTADTADTFTVTVDDGYGGVVTVPVTVAIGAANTAPTVTAGIVKPDPVSGVSGGKITGGDAESDPLTYTASTPANGAVVLNADGTFTYTPTAAARIAARSSTTATTDAFTITANDGYGGTTSTTVTATIAPSDTAPVAGTPTASTAASTGVVSGSVNATDPEQDALTYTAATVTTAKGSASVTSSGAYTYTPTAAARHAAAKVGAKIADTTDTFSVTVTDKYGASATVPVGVTISPSNAVPVAGTTTAGAPNASTGVVAGSAMATDANSDTLTFGGSASTAKGAVTVKPDGTFSYTPTAAARHAAAKVGAGASATSDTFSVTVSDGYGGSVTIPVTVAISPSNAAPVAGTSKAGSPNASNGVITGSVSATDANSDPLTFSGSASTAKGSVTVNADGTFSYTPTAAARHAAAKVGAGASATGDTFSVTVSDGYGGSVTIPVTVAISPSNTAPVAGTLKAGSPNVSNGVITGSVSATDANSDTLTFSGSASTAKGSVTVNADGTFTYTPTAAARHAAAKVGAGPSVTTDTFTVTASDGYGGSVGVPVTVSISPTNTVPVAGAPAAGAPNASTGVVTGSVSATDANSDPLTFGGSASTAKGSVTVNADGTFTYTPTAAARHAAAMPGAGTSTDTFTITVSDGYGGSASVPVTVTVVPGNNAPVAGSTSAGAPNASTGVVTGSVTAMDPNGDPLIYTGSTGTGKGSVTVNANGTFTYTPTDAARHAAAKIGAGSSATSDTFTVTVSDGYGGTVTVPVTVAVGASNATPVPGSPNAGAPNASTGVVSGSVSATDANGDPLTYSAPASTSKGSVTINASTGTFTFTPTASARQDAANGGATTDSFTITITDGYGGTVTAPVTVSIGPVIPAKVSFTFSYGSGSQYWSQDARNALQSTAASLASYFVVTAPVTINVDVTGSNSASGGTLAYASADFTSGGPGYYGTVIQSKVISGVDSNGSAADAVVDYNWAYPWALGSSVPGNQYDFKAVALHELLHAMGFLSGTESPSSQNTNWTTFDTFLSTSNGTAVIGSDYTVIPAYTASFTGANGGLYFDGPNAVAVNGGPVKLYTPSNWSSGSSVSHLNQATGNVMNPFMRYGPGVRTLTPVEIAVMRDLGYTMNNSPSVLAFVLVWWSPIRRRRRR